MTIANELHLAITTALRGAGGGGGSARQPIESPDSLRSIAYARIVDLVSEGEIFGFADQANPLTCVYLNETPVANADGTLNFRNIQIDSRVGTQNQDPLPNFDGVENEIGVGVELRATGPWVRSITNINIDSLRIRLSTPAMTTTDTTNGDIKGATVVYRIDLQTDGGTFETLYTGSMRGKTTSKYERTHRIELPPATAGWVVRVMRLTPDSESASVQNKTFIESYAEIIEAKLRMPMSALVSVIVDAEQFPNIPSRAYRLKGRIIRVPSNYNPDTRTYTGVWDGTFQSRYSNNPAWVFYDMALNNRYGLGHLIPQGLMDKWALYRIGQYCDAEVDDGFGGKEPRFTCNLVLQSQGDALRVMQDLATVFRGVIYASGGTVTPVGDMPEDPVYTYGPANVIDGKFNYSGSNRKVRHTVALVTWNDLSDFGRAKIEYVDDPDGIARYGIQQTEVMAVGCTSRGQARRMGRYLLATERYETDSVSFGVGMDGTIVAPGKVVNIADPLRQGVRRTGRVRSATTLRVTPDLLPSGVAVGDRLIAIMPNGVAETRNIIQVTATELVVQSAYSSVPVAESVWAVESNEVPVQRYRVLGVSEVQGESLGYNVVAIKHENGKFAFADSGVLINTPPVPPVPTGAVPAPTGLTVTHRDVADQNTAVKVVNLSWDTVQVATSYNVLWRQSDGNWVDLGTTGFTNIDISNIRPGGFEVQVMAINSFGERSVPAFGGPYDVPAVATPPGYVGDVRGELAQEIIDRFNADAQVAQDAAEDAQVKADAAKADALDAVEAAKAQAAAANAQAMAAAAAAQSAADALAAEVGEIVNAPNWDSTKEYQAGWIVKEDGKLYRAEVTNTNVRPSTNPATWEYLGDYSSVAEVAAAALSVANTTATELGAQVTRIDAVTARMPAGTGELATSATVAANEAASVSRDNALGSRTSTVEARMPAGNGVLATGAATQAAADAAAAAAAAAGNKGKVIFQSATPAAADQLAQNLWIDTTNGANTPKRWSGSAWVVVTDKAATDAAAAAAAAQSSVNTLSATVTANETASVNRDNALGTRTTAIEVRMPTGTDKLANEARVVAAESAAASATQAVANRATALEAKIVNIGGDNMLPNSSFEERASDTSAPTWWVSGGNISGGLTRSYVDSELTGSTKAFRIAAAAPTTGQYQELRTPDSVLKVMPGEKFIASAYARCPVGACTVSIIIWFLTSAGATIGSALQDTFTPTTAWQRFVSTVRTAPANAAYVRVYFREVVTVAAQPLQVDWDNVQFQKGDVATNWMPSVTESNSKIDSVSATVTANESASVTRDNALGTRTSAIEARMPTGTDKLANEARVVAAESAAASATAAVATRTAAVEASVAVLSTSGQNAVLNGGWENAQDVGWSYLGSHYGVVAEGVNGGRCYKSVPGSGVNQATANKGVAVDVQPGRKYRYACSYRTDAAFNGTADNSRLRLSDQADGLLGGATVFAANQTAWTLLEAIYTVPANTSITGLKLKITANNTTGNLWVDNVVLEDVTDVQNLSAVVTTNETASVSRDNALGTRVGVVEARMPAGSGSLATSASVTNLQTAMTTADQQLAQDITNVQATANGAQSTATQALTAANGAATAVTQVKQALNGGNLIDNATFPNWSAAGWQWFLNGPNWDALNTVGKIPEFVAASVNSALVMHNAATVASGAQALAGITKHITVEVGKTYCVSAYVNTYRCRGRVSIEWADQNGSPIGSVPSAWANDSAIPATNQLISVFPRLFVIETAPAGAAMMRFTVTVEGTGQADPYMWLFYPQVCEVLPGTTAPPPWAPGGNELSSVTQVLSADVKAKYGLYLQSGNLISGFESSNNGIVADFNILATIFKITSPAGGARTEFSNGNWRVYDSNGVLRSQFGVNI